MGVAMSDALFSFWHYFAVAFAFMISAPVGCMIGILVSSFLVPESFNALASDGIINASACPSSSLFPH